MLILAFISNKRLELLNFVSVIQLVTALNFANISSSLHEKMFKVLVDVKTFFNIRFGELQNKMTADLESLKSMSPIEAKDGKSNKSTIDELTNEYLDQTLPFCFYRLFIFSQIKNNSSYFHMRSDYSLIL